MSVRERCQWQDVQPVAHSTGSMEDGSGQGPERAPCPALELDCPGTSPRLLSDLNQVPRPVSSLMVVIVGTSEGYEEDFKS